MLKCTTLLGSQSSEASCRPGSGLLMSDGALEHWRLDGNRNNGCWFTVEPRDYYVNATRDEGLNATK